MPWGSVPLLNGDKVYVRAENKHLVNKQALGRWTCVATVEKTSPRNAFYCQVRWISKGLDGTKTLICIITYILTSIPYITRVQRRHRVQTFLPHQQAETRRHQVAK